MSKVQVYKNDVFISHSKKDVEFVREVAIKLKKAGIRLFFDEWNIKYGEDIVRALNKGLEASKTILFFMSKSSLNSNWVEYEQNISIFNDPLNLNLKLIPILIEDCDIPDSLKRLKYIDARGKNITSIINSVLETLELDEPRKLKFKENILLGTRKQDVADAKSKFNPNNELYKERKKIVTELINLKDYSINKKSSITSFYVDIDGFRLINAKYGFGIGNDIIQIINGIFEQRLLKHNIFLWGADEFIGCLNGISENQVITLLEEIRNIVECYDWSNLAENLYVTISIGYATYKQGKIKEDFESWVERSIVGCFNSKKAGGNKVSRGPKYLEKNRKPSTNVGSGKKKAIVEFLSRSSS